MKTWEHIQLWINALNKEVMVTEGTSEEARVTNDVNTSSADGALPDDRI